jgi:hypothetical protein
MFYGMVRSGYSCVDDDVEVRYSFTVYELTAQRRRARENRNTLKSRILCSNIIPLLN